MVERNPQFHDPRQYEAADLVIVRPWHRSVVADYQARGVPVDHLRPAEVAAEPPPAETAPETKLEAAAKPEPIAAAPSPPPDQPPTPKRRGRRPGSKNRKHDRTDDNNDSRVG